MSFALSRPLADLWSFFHGNGNGPFCPPEGMFCKLLSVLGLILLLCLTGGCASKSVPDPMRMTLAIHPAPTANQGQVFYMVVRATNEKQFLTETYVRITELVFADPPDPTVLGAFPIFPDTRQTLTVAKPAQNPLALYFLFTRPSDDWRFLLEQPLADEYTITVEGNTVEVREVQSFWSRIFS